MGEIMLEYQQFEENRCYDTIGSSQHYNSKNNFISEPEKFNLTIHN